MKNENWRPLIFNPPSRSQGPTILSSCWGRQNLTLPKVGRLIDQQQIQNGQSEATERLREALQDAIRRVKVRPDEDLNELGSASTQGGGKVLGPQKPTE